MGTPQTEVKRSSFPKDFIFGGATSAYQVEGAWNVGGKGWSNWDFMTQMEPGSIKDGSNGCMAINHYNLVKQDVASMKEIGLNSYRFSISWSRILPGGKLCDGISKEGIKFYNDLIDMLLEQGIEPCATIFHWDVPLDLENEYGGFLDRRIVEHFCEFAEICFWEFGDRVKYWVTLNEPWSFTVCGYVVKRFPPRRGYALQAASPPDKSSTEQALCNSILQHRSNMIIPSLPSSKGNVARAVDDTADNLPSSEEDPITELVRKAYILANENSFVGDAVRKLVAAAYSWAYNESPENDAEGGGGYYDYSNPASSQVREVASPNAQNLPSSQGDSARDSKANNLPSLTSSKRDRPRICSVPQNLRQLTPSKGDPVKVSSKPQTPGVFSSKGDPGTEPYTVAHNLILAHAYAVNIYRRYYQEHQQGKIGMTNVSMWYYPLDKDEPEDVEAASRALDFLLGWFVAPVISGDYPPSMRNNIRKRLPKFKPDEVAVVKGSCDFLGINYYTARYAKNLPRRISTTHYTNDMHVDQRTHRNNKPIGKKAGSDWLYIVPDGLYKIMLYIKEKYNDPEIIITENGVNEERNDRLQISVALNDETRVNYYRDHIAYLKRAMDDGVRLKGYYIWSFFDNFEWDSGYNVRFGVYHVDFMNGLERRAKRSAEWWQRFLSE